MAIGVRRALPVSCEDDVEAVHPPEVLATIDCAVVAPASCAAETAGICSNRTDPLAGRAEAAGDVRTRAVPGEVWAPTAAATTGVALITTEPGRLACGDGCDMALRELARG